MHNIKKWRKKEGKKLNLIPNDSVNRWNTIIFFKCQNSINEIANFVNAWLCIKVIFLCTETLLDQKQNMENIRFDLMFWNKTH